jgi:hypothetical protein
MAKFYRIPEVSTTTSDLDGGHRISQDDLEDLPIISRSRCISDARTLLFRVQFSKISNGTAQYFLRSFLEINSVLHPVFDVSIRGQVPGNVSLILTVPIAVLDR